jgi:osmotically-inducible protein OsmY
MGIRENEVIGQVRHALARDPMLDAPKISITFLGDTVALTGVLDTEEEVYHAEQVARTAAPGVAIDNGLTVSFTHDAAGKHVWQDSELQRVAEQALAAARDEIKTRPATASVEVQHGIAHLRGSCSTAKDRQYLIKAVADVTGVKRVIGDDLQVKPFGSADDIRLGNLAIEKLQRLSPDLAGAVRVDVRNRAAHLIGSVRSGRDRCRAEDVVMQVPGIKHVHNELTVYQEETSTDPEVKIEQAVRHAIGAAGLPKPNIHAYYTSGVLTLDGEIESVDQHRMAIKVVNETLKRLVGDMYQINDMLKVESRRGLPPHPESDLLQREAHPSNSPVVPLHERGPDFNNKAKHTQRIEDRIPGTQEPPMKRKDRD